MIAIALIAVAWFLSIVIRFALSRPREFLADAGAVELTKNPDAMISALRKIENRGELHGATSAVMEMCVDNPREGFADLFATHPSVDSARRRAGASSPAATIPARSRCRNSIRRDEQLEAAGRRKPQQPQPDGPFGPSRAVERRRQAVPAEPPADRARHAADRGARRRARSRTMGTARWLALAAAFARALALRARLRSRRCAPPAAP